jgi:hypothetical protein
VLLAAAVLVEAGSMRGNVSPFDGAGGDDGAVDGGSVAGGAKDGEVSAGGAA